MEAWRKTWREGIAHQLPTVGLEALAVALEEDDPRLGQGYTTEPPPLQSVQDWPVESGDAIVFCYVAEHGGFLYAGYSVGEAEEFFARVSFEADQLLGEPSACRHFINWFDETPRDEMRRLLLPEVKRVLDYRFGLEAGGFGPDDPVGIVLDWVEQYHGLSTP